MKTKTSTLYNLYSVSVNLVHVYKSSVRILPESVLRKEYWINETDFERVNDEIEYACN